MGVHDQAKWHGGPEPHRIVGARACAPGPAPPSSRLLRFAALAQECTFAPQVGRPPEASRHRHDLPVEERLIRRAAGKREMLERVKEAQESAGLVECTFAPQVRLWPTLFCCCRLG
jgi:hypothetical protein